MTRRVSTDKSLRDARLSNWAEGISHLMKMAKEAGPKAMPSLIRDMSSIRYAMGLLTETMDRPDPGFDWQYKRLEILAQYLTDRVDLLYSESYCQHLDKEDQ